jgi:hypothetical protein
VKVAPQGDSLTFMESDLLDVPGTPMVSAAVSHVGDGSALVVDNGRNHRCCHAAALVFIGGAF